MREMERKRSRESGDVNVYFWLSANKEKNTLYHITASHVLQNASSES